MITIGLTITYLILLLLGFLWYIFLNIYKKRVNKLGLVFYNLVFISFEETQNYFLENKIKLDDWFFSALKDIHDKYGLDFQKKARAWNHIFWLSIIFWVSIPLFSRVFFYIFPTLGVSVFYGMPVYLISQIFFFLFMLNIAGIYSKYKIIVLTKWDNIDNWRLKNKEFTDNNYITQEELRALYNKKCKDFKKYKITNIKRPLIYVNAKIDYEKTDKKIFDTPEKYLYFILILPYNVFKINFKKTTHNFIKEL